jgi:hypothetical protein
MDVNHKIAIFQGDNTIFNDAASVLKWVMNKVSLGATDTVMGKISFTQQRSFYKVKHYPIMMIIVLSLRRCFGATTKNGKVSPSPALVPNTRMPVCIIRPCLILCNQWTHSRAERSSGCCNRLNGHSRRSVPASRYRGSY